MQDDNNQITISEYPPDFEPITQEANIGIQPQIVSVTNLVANNPTLKPPVIHGLLREGETCNLIAASKTWKSFMTLDMLISVATGEKFLGTFDTSQGKALLLDNELHAGTLANRMPLVCEAAGVQLDTLENSLFVDCLRGRLVNLYQMKTFFASIEPRTYKLIVLDALYRFWPPGMSENDNNAVTQVYNMIDEFAARLGCAFVLVHHASKGEQGGKSNIDVGSGAGAMARAADCHIAIRPHENEQLHVLTASVRSWAPVEPRTIRFNFPRWYPDATEPVLKVAKSAFAIGQEKQRQNDVDEICNHFEPGKPFGWYDVGKHIGCGESRATNIIKLAISQSRIEQHKRMKRKHAKKATMTYKISPTTTGNDNGNDNVVLPVVDT